MEKKRRRSRNRLKCIPNAPICSTERPNGPDDSRIPEIQLHKNSTQDETISVSIDASMDELTAEISSDSECSIELESLSHSDLEDSAQRGQVEDNTVLEGSQSGVHEFEGQNEIEKDIESDASSLPSDSNGIESEVVHTGLTGIRNWRVLWALIATLGSKKFTKTQYQSIRRLVDTLGILKSDNWKENSFRANMSAPCSSRVVLLPHSSTVDRTAQKLLFQKLTPRFVDRLLPVDMSKAGAKIAPIASTSGPTTRVRIVLPSEYARADVSTPDVFSAMCSASLRNQDSGNAPMDSECIDICPIIAARNWFYGPASSFSVDQSSQSDSSPADFAEVGDLLSIDLATSLALKEEFTRSFTNNEQNSAHSIARGVVLAIWTVHHTSRKSDSDFKSKVPSDLSERDKAIVKSLNFVDYKSPTDSVTIEVPALPSEEERGGAATLPDSDSPMRQTLTPEMLEAVKQRRAALKQQKKQIEIAWRDWIQPVLKPGDIIALLRPCSSLESTDNLAAMQDKTMLTSTDMNSRICLVLRFWIEDQERSRTSLWIPGGRDITAPPGDNRLSQAAQFPFLESPSTQISRMSSSCKLSVPIRSVHLISAHTGLRGPEKYAAVSSVGHLANGEPYIVYRFLLYWDGFEVQTGKQASGDGIYLVCLNIPRHARDDASAVRIISLTPPGVKCEDIMETIVDDIVVGMTKGFIDYDAEGARRRIFLDLVACLGDTPALNATLDVLGHTASACCHLCRFVRAPNSTEGSRYATNEFNRCFTASRRTFFQHQGVRDCGSKKETCRLLGILYSERGVDAALLNVRQRMVASKEHVPKTSEGYPVVPSDFDPYRACLVAPDHLLTSHLRDCINLAFQMVPSRSGRKSCEAHMLALLKEISAPSQNRLFDHVKKTLHSMSISDLYSLALVAEIGFKRGCADELELPLTSSAMRSCNEAVSLVASAAKLIVSFWYIPMSHLDGNGNSREFRHSHFRGVQSLVADHISRVRRICTDCISSENTITSTRRKGSDPRRAVRSIGSLAQKLVDKPNVHRLQELSMASLPMFGHVSYFGELSLEKTHQILKRALRQSNNKESHLQAIKSAVFDDWQARLTLAAPLISQNTPSAVLACFRLFYGREAVAYVGAKLDHELVEIVRSTIGPDACILKELQMQNKSVISRKATDDSAWVHGGEKLTLSEDQRDSEEGIIRILKNAFPFQWESIQAHTVTAATKEFAHDTRLQRIKSGDIVETLIVKSNAPNCHLPFVLQASCMQNTLNPGMEMTNSIWYVQAILQFQGMSLDEFLYIIALPCIPSNNEGIPRSFRVDFSRPSSLARLDFSVRKVPVIPDCPTSVCSVDKTFNRIQHSDACNARTSTTFYPFTRETGFPPRKG